MTDASQARAPSGRRAGPPRPAPARDPADGATAPVRRQGRPRSCRRATRVDQLARIEDKCSRIEDKYARSEALLSRVEDKVEGAVEPDERGGPPIRSRGPAHARCAALADRTRRLPGTGALVLTAIITAVLTVVLMVAVQRLNLDRLLPPRLPRPAPRSSNSPRPETGTA